MSRSITGVGTPELVWTRWRPAFPPLDLDDCPALVLVGPHPDDETLGLGGTAALLADRGVDVRVVTVTDGEAAYPRRGRGAEAGLATRRRGELAAATKALGLPAPDFLGIPDGQVARQQRRVADALVAVLDTVSPGAWCAATWRGDGHPDHEAVGRAAAEASMRAHAVLLEYPIWMWHWATPDDAVPWDRALRVPLTKAALLRKAAAVHCFASQLEPGDGPPVLTPAVVSRLMAVGEVVFAQV